MSMYLLRDASPWLVKGVDNGVWTTIEGWHLGDDGKKFYTKTWRPKDGKVRAYMVFIHGFSDHCNRYDELFRPLVERGIEVRSFDGRGWGRTMTDKWSWGDTGPTRVIMADINSFLKSVISLREHPTAPIFLMGHSLGATQVLTFAATGPPSTKAHIRGYLIEGPYVSPPPQYKPWPITVATLRLLTGIAPKFQYFVSIDLGYVSRDPAIQRSLVTDKLCHKYGTLEAILSMLDQGLDLESGRVRIPADAGEGNATRILVTVGGADRVCDFDATAKMFGSMDPRIADKELKVYEGWYHQLHNDAPGKDRLLFANDTADWILARSGPLWDKKLEVYPPAEHAVQHTVPVAAA